MNRFSKMSIKNKEFSNRIIIPPMASETASEAGFVTEATLRHYFQLSKARASLLFVEYTYVLSSGRSEGNQLGIDLEEHVLGLSKLAGLIHKTNSLAGIQLTHAGGKSQKTFTGGVLMAPSSISVPVKDIILELPDEMSLDDINNWKEGFIAGAKRAMAAGFDVIELHAAHGYGLNQWLSPITNNRQDEYGGSLEKRSRLLMEIVKSIRVLDSSVILAVRLPGQDFLEGGLTQKDSVQIAKLLVQSGVDMIDVSSGIGGWKRPRERRGQGYLVEEAAFLQSELLVPVIGVGGIETGEFIDELIESKKITFAAVGRAILNNPKTWGQTHLKESV